jgi:hypothetical protein
MRNISTQSGSIIVSIMVIMIFLTMTVLSLGVISQSNLTRATQRIHLLQAQYAAESGADAVVAYLNSSSGTYPSSGVEKELFTYAPTYRATYQATVTDHPTDANKKVVSSIGRVYQPSTATSAKRTYTLNVTLDRSSVQFTSSIVSRNSVEVASSVKAVVAGSLYVNEYLRVNKNTTDITIDDLTVAGKYPDGNSCSISGTGNLVRNSNLPAGTKAKIVMAYSNCMDVPPGNTSDADFDITANDSSLQKIASIYIPWSYKMNNDDGGGAYTNGNCSDWTAASPTLPSSGNARKTHYPDSGAGVVTASSCGGSDPTPADLSLGNKTYTLNDHVHVRANLCKASSCTPKFINPDADSPKFVFVEGVINFERVTVDSSSPGEVIFISYSTSQTISASKQCPSNSAAIRLGKDGSNSLLAPKAYFIATNGMLCVDQTKFDSGVQSLGGVSGKDIYLSSNSGATFELTFNPSFPLSSIPLDLSWRASNIKRVY